jgi:hypothetical protein
VTASVGAGHGDAIQRAVCRTPFLRRLRGNRVEKGRPIGWNTNRINNP